MNKYETSLQLGDDALTAAIEYHRLGWSLLPIKPGTKEPALCSWKSFQQTPADEITLRDWFQSRDDLGLAVICGAVSRGLTCRDFDVADSYHRWASGHPDLARTLPTVATGRPGFHVYHRSDVRKIEKLGDGELRGNGYCLLPPSIHPNGQPYRWIVPPGDSIPLIDPYEVGLTGVGHATEENRDDRDNRCNCSVVSVHSVLSVAEGDDAIVRAIRESLPTAPGLRHRQVFELARALKAVPSLFDAGPKSLKQYVRQWYQLALPVITSKEFDETWADFVIAWPKIKFPKGSEPMSRILAAAVQAPIPVVAEQYDHPKTRLLISICRELQRTAGDNPFFLDCRTAGRMIEAEHTTAWRWLRVLEADGVLFATDRGSKATRKATRFKYLPPL
jgi:hypothetical protein